MARRYDDDDDDDDRPRRSRRRDEDDAYEDDDRPRRRRRDEDDDDDDRPRRRRRDEDDDDDDRSSRRRRDEEEETPEERERKRKQKRKRRKAAALGQLFGPALALMICASVHLVIQCVTFPLAILNLVTLINLAGPGAPEVPRLIGNLIGGLIGMAVQAFIIYGAIQLKNATNYGVAMATVILSLIPCLCSSCVILGIPFGIWGLIVLMDEDVKSVFR